VTVQLVAVYLVRDEDVFVERAIPSVAHVCDPMVAVDHLSRDGTGEILRRLAKELPHLEVRRSGDARDSHRAIEEYAGTRNVVPRRRRRRALHPAGLVELKERRASGP
jgi:hypothetical protein